MNLVELDEFLNGCSYSQNDLDFIHKYFKEGKSSLSILRQIYAKLGVLTNRENEYYRIFRFLKSNYDLGCNVLEICGGHYPILSEYIDKEQRNISCGTITVYDPKLVVNKLGNVNLVKDKFTKDIDISKYDLIISQSPCGVFQDIIDSSIGADKDYFIALCSCVYIKFFSQIPSDNLYFSSDYDPVLDIIYSDICKEEQGRDVDIYTGEIEVPGNVIKYINRKKY